MDNKNVFAYNLRMYMEAKNKSRNDISEALGISYFTVSDWVNGKKYPRMDKIEMLANFFGIQKSDLIESKVVKQPIPVLSETEKKLLDLFRQVPEDKKNMVIEMIRVALS